MERKKELKIRYKEIEIESGIYQIKNTENGKIFIGSTRNLKTLNGVKFTLENNTHFNKILQEEWNKFGKDAFVFEILENLEKSTDLYFNEKEELEKLEKKWLAQLHPYGEQGYNKKTAR